MKRGLLKVKVEVSGKNVAYLTEILHRRGILVYKVNKILENTLEYTIDFNELRKIFAICKDMCYNTMVKGFKGALSIIAYAISYVGVTIGLTFFIALIVLLDGLIYSVDCVGTGAVIKNEILSVATENGAVKYNWFNNVNLSKLETEILKHNANLKFVSCYKRGNRLIIDSVLGNDSAINKTPLNTDLLCEKSGVIESITVLRGTPLVSVGDVVTVGSGLIGAYTENANGERFSSAVLGAVSILATEKYNFKTEIFSQTFLDASIQKAKFLTDGEVVYYVADKTNDGYVVTLTARYIYYGG